MSVRVLSYSLHVCNMRARMPFRYGIATLTALPHLFVRAVVNVDGRETTGHSADSLPPKWFTKDPETQFVDDIADMIAVVRHAGDSAVAVGAAPDVFDLWSRLDQMQREWAAREGFPPLLSGFGTSLIERAVIDAVCRAKGVTFAEAVHAGHLGIRLDAIYPELEGVVPSDVLPVRPLASLSARHTIGLGDPLRDDEIAGDDRLNDGLPQSVEAVIRTYGVSHFKLKLVGDPERDHDRLREFSQLLDRQGVRDFRITLDGNENFHELDTLREWWEMVVADRELRRLVDNLVFVEQPLHRDVALGDDAGRMLDGWPDRPRMIIDESDGEADTLRRALDLGYAGTSHKNCKGVFKSIANACLIAARREATDDDLVLSAEDLTNVGPVALMQDLAVVATLGISHVERNGHHYFAGLRHLPADMQDAVLAHHGDLYHRGARDFATLDIRNGQIATGGVVSAPFGYDFDFDPTRFTPIDAWSPETLDAT